MEMLSGAEMVVQSLVDQGVKQVFGYPGGAVLDIYDALHTLGGIDHVLVRHEQAAVHMADGLARATGEVGVVLVTSGPGATNAITGIATAYMDSIPLVILSGQVATSLIGYDAFQECDMGHHNIRSYMRRFRSHRPGLTAPDRPARLLRRHR